MILETLFTGRSASFTAFVLSGTPQQRNDKKPFFFGDWLPVIALEVTAFAFPAVPRDGPRGVVDILLLAVLPFRLLPSMLDFDSFERPPILPLGSLAVIPLRIVAVGEGWILLDEDLDGT